MTEKTIIAANPDRAKWGVTGFLILLLVTEIYFLLNDIPILSPVQFEMAKTKSAPIAELVTKHNGVRYQNPDDLVWEETKTGQTLYRRQSVLTLDKSQAEIAFLDGTGLVLDENSMIQLEKSPGDDSLGYQKIVIKLLRGTLHKREARHKSEILRKLGPSTPEFQIQVGEIKADLTPASEFTVTATPETAIAARISVRSGELSLESPQGEVKVKEGEETTIPKESEKPIAPRRATFTLLSPIAGQVLRVSGQEPVKFRWKNDADGISGSPLELQVSADPEFKTVLASKRIPAAEPPLKYVETSVAVSAQPNPLFWRVRAINQENAISEAERFFASQLPQPALLFPAANAKVTEREAVDFAWSGVEGASEYEFQVGDEPPARVKETFAQVQSVSPNATHWKVRAKLSDGSLSQWSEERRLAVTAQAPTPMPQIAAPPAPASEAPPALAAPTKEPAPEPAAPAAPARSIKRPPPPPNELMDAEIKENDEPAPTHSWLDFLIHPAWGADAPPVKSWKVHLKWKAVPGVSKYKVQIGRTRAFKEILAESETDSPQWNWKYKIGMENTKGRVFYRVASIDDEGSVGRYSEPKAVPIPKHILDAARAIARKSESFPAVVGDEGVPTDAAEGSDLQKESAKVAEKAKPAPAVTPAPTQTPPSSELVGPPVPAPKPQVAKVAPAKKEAPQVPAGPVYVTSWNWSASVNAGMGNLSQTSAADDLTGVSMQSPFLRQRVFVLGHLLQKSIEEEKGWNLQLQMSFASFQSGDSRLAFQPKVSAFTVKAEAIQWAKTSNSWEIGWGGMLERSFRWQKQSLQNVAPVSGFSLGPSALAVRNYSYATGLSPVRVGLSLGVPITGIVMGGAYGIEGNAWGEWKLHTFENKNWLGLQLEAESDYARWSKPSGTSTFAWVFWFSPVFHF